MDMKNKIKILPSTLEYQKKNWEYTHDWRQPVKPRFEIKCPICGGKTRWKHYNPHIREYKVAGRQPRFDVCYKCEQCGYVMTFGVHITEEYYREIEQAMLKNLGRVRTLHILEVIDRENELR